MGAVAAIASVVGAGVGLYEDKRKRDRADKAKKKAEKKQDQIQARETDRRQGLARAAISDNNKSLFDLLGSSQ